LALGGSAMAEPMKTAPVKTEPVKTISVGFGVEVPVHAVQPQTAGFGVKVTQAPAGGRGFRGDNPKLAQTVRGFGVIVDE